MVETAQYVSESLSPFSIVNRVVDWPCCPAFPNFPCSEKWPWPWAHSREGEHKACMPVLGQSWSSGHASSILTRWRAVTAKFKQIWKSHVEWQGLHQCGSLKDSVEPAPWKPGAPPSDGLWDWNKVLSLQDSRGPIYYSNLSYLN